MYRGYNLVGAQKPSCAVTRVVPINIVVCSDRKLIPKQCRIWNIEYQKLVTHVKTCH